MSPVYEICVRTAFGLESVTAGELRHLGYGELVTENGRIIFPGSTYDLARCNYRLRTADRVQLRLAAFTADNLDALFEGIQAVSWGDLLPKEAAITTLARCDKGWMQSERTCQSLTKKAVITVMQRKYGLETLPENGREYVLTTEISGTRAEVFLDSSGEGLHKRGYRKAAGEAPLRETVAAAMVLLARWFGKVPLHDPFCGSGTIPIEAAMIALDLAPGRGRRFPLEQWGFLDAAAVARARDEAQEVGPWKSPSITGTDIDPRMIPMAEAAAAKAGVSRIVTFRTADAAALDPGPGPGLILCNPPWGERLGEEESARETARAFGAACKKLPGWECGVLSALQGYERDFGTRALKNRKLYNGKLLCRFYTFPPPAAKPAPPRGAGRPPQDKRRGRRPPPHRQ